MSRSRFGAGCPSGLSTDSEQCSGSRMPGCINTVIPMGFLYDLWFWGLVVSDVGVAGN